MLFCVELSKSDMSEREGGGQAKLDLHAHQSNNLWTMITLLNHNFVFNRTIKMLINNDEHEMKMSWHENKKPGEFFK
jgi:hypothetical protein